MIHRKKKGFSLVEMLVVIAIIAVLVAIVTPMIAKSTVKAAAATNASNLRAAKGAFTTMKLMYPEDYTSWTGGTIALTGVTAKDEKFTITGDATAAGDVAKPGQLAANVSGPVLMSAADPLTVVAKDAVEMKIPNVITIEEGTPMNAQILVNDDGTHEVYVTYNDLPIAFFAAVAEDGTANPADYIGKKGHNTAAGGAWMDRLANWGNEIANNAAKKEVMGFSLYGNLISQMTDIMNDTASQGDCLQCAMNNVSTNDSGLLGAIAGDKVTSLLATKGYEWSGYDVNDESTYGNKAYCAAYNPIYAGGGCSCNKTHGKEAHVSTTSKVGIGEGFESCSAGGVHSLDKNHLCSKCNQKFHLNADGTPKHEEDDSIPYMGTILSGSCKYCNYCACCAKTGTKTYTNVINENFSLTNAFMTKDFPDGYKLAFVRKSFDNVLTFWDKNDVITIEGYCDGGVCMSTDPVLGDLGKDGKDKGCGHSLAAHMD